MEKSFEQHRKELIRQAIEHWEDKGELEEIVKDPVVKLLFSALAYQSYSISQEIDTFQEMTVNEFRNKLIPYHLIKPFPALSIVQTGIKENTNEQGNLLTVFQVDNKSTFEFGKNKIPFTPLFNTKIINAEISGQRINSTDNSIEWVLSSKEIIEDFSGISFYLEGIDTNLDIEISMNNQLLPVIKPDDYDNLPFADWFQHHFLLAEENQLQLGNYDYWQEFYLKHQFPLFYIGEYDTDKIHNMSYSPVFKITFKNQLHPEYLRDCTVKINCLPIVNVQKTSVALTEEEPVKKLSTEKNAFLNLLTDENTGNNTDDFIIRHFGIERYNRQELLFQLNDLFNRFISDYYAFKDMEELKKGEKLEGLYKSIKELLPIIKKNNINDSPSVYAILKLNDKLTHQNKNVKIDFLNTHCEFANGIKKGEKPVSTSEFLDKENTFLLIESAGGKTEERNEENLNHLARYNLLTKDKLVTSSDLKAFCYRELKNKIKDVSVKNTGEKIVIHIRLKEEYLPYLQEKEYYEALIQHKMNVRSLLSIPIHVIIDI